MMQANVSMTENALLREIFETMEYGTVLESDDIAQQYLENHGRTLKAFIGGKEYDPEDQRKVHERILNPCTAEFLCVVQKCGLTFGFSDEMSAATKISWYDLQTHGRSQHLHRVADCIEKNQKLLALLESLSTGKLFRHVIEVDVPTLVSLFHKAADEALLRDDSEWELSRNLFYLGIDSCQYDQYNGIFQSAWDIAYSLAAGSTAILFTWRNESFISAYFIAELFKEAGVPDGVFNVVPYLPPGAVPSHSSNCLEKCIVKDQVMNRRQTVLVFDSADLHSAADGAIATLCKSASGVKLLVQESIHKKFFQILKEKFSKLRVGTSLDKNADLTAVFCNKLVLNKWRTLLSECETQGSEICKLEVSNNVSTYAYSPILVDCIQTSLPMMEQQLCWHYMLVQQFRTQKEAIALANHSQPGGEVLLWTERTVVALEVALKLNRRCIGINGQGNLVEWSKEQKGGFCIGDWYNFMKSKVKPQQSTSTARLFTPYTIVLPFKLYYGGKYHSTNESISVVDEDSKMVIGKVAAATEKDAKNAASAARSALPSWSALPRSSRGTILRRIADKLKPRRKEFVKMLGMNVSAPEEEFDNSIESLYFWAALSQGNNCGDVSETGTCSLKLTIHQPRGIIKIECINSRPLLYLITSIAAALSYGNCVIAIPSYQFPLPAVNMYQVFEDAGVPAGVINVLTCNDMLQPNVDATWGDTYFLNSSEFQFNMDDADFSASLQSPALISRFQHMSTRRKNVYLQGGDIFAN